MSKIGFVFPQKECVDEVKSALRGSEVEILVASDMTGNGIEAAKAMVDAGANIILAPEGMGQRIQGQLAGGFVLEVPVGVNELAKIAAEIEKIKEPIALIPWGSTLEQIQNWQPQMLTQENVTFYVATCETSIEDYLDRATADGAKWIVSGPIVCQSARKRGFKILELLPSCDAYIEGYYYARNLVALFDLIRTSFNSLTEGLMTVDKNGYIGRMNTSAQRILEHPWKPSEQKLISAVWPELDLKSVFAGGDEEKDQFVHFRGRLLYVHKIPTALDRGSTGAFILFWEVEHLQKILGNIRREFYKKNYSAVMSFDQIEPHDKITRQLIDTGRGFAQLDASVVISGEIGTGKADFAQCIHQASRRKEGPFVEIHCGAFTPELLQRELFGYVSGTFLDAGRQSKTGLIELAHQGTLFINEISEMDYATQGRLLRLMSEKVITRLGSDQVIPVNVRVIVATTKNLTDLVKNGIFREELYYRLNVLSVHLPPLKGRKKEIAHYSQLFLNEIASQMGRKRFLSASALDLLEKYDWPGNLREIRNVMERLVGISQREKLSGSYISKILSPLFSSEAIPEVTFMREEESEKIREALAATQGNISLTAQRMGISRVTLWRHMNRLGIDKKNWR